MNKFFYKALILCGALFFLCPVVSIFAESVSDQLKIIEKAVHIAVSRIESGLVAEPAPGEEFLAMSGRQFELAALSLSAAHLLEEDYYNLALFMMASHFKKYDAAIKVLEYEFKQTSHRGLKKWLSDKIESTRKNKSESVEMTIKKVFSIEEEFRSLRKSLWSQK